MTRTAKPTARRSFVPRGAFQWFVVAILLLALFYYLMPLYVMIVTGLKDAQNVSMATMWRPPTQPDRRRLR